MTVDPSPDDRLPVLVDPAEIVGVDRDLSEATIARIKRAPAQNTVAAYDWQWRVFADWCEDRARQALPATPETLAEYVAALCDGHRGMSPSPSTVEQAIACIRTKHRQVGYKGQPDTEGALLVLKTHRRDLAENDWREAEAKPVTIEALRRMVSTRAYDTPRGLRDRALLVLGFAMMARRSELAALSRTDVREVDNGLEVFVRKSKTDQAAKGRQVNVPRGQNPLTDPVRVLRAWTELLDREGEHDGRLFRSVDRWGNLGRSMQSRVVGEVVYDAAVKAGLDDPETYSAHSLRAGGATEAYRAGVPVTTICDHGGWKRGSPVVLGYIRAVDAWRDNAMLGVGL